MEDLIRDSVIPGSTVIALAALLLALLLAFRRERLAPFSRVATGPSPPPPVREVTLFRLSYPVAFETGHLEAISARRRALRTASGAQVAWRTSPVDGDVGPETPLSVLVAGGYVIASWMPTSLLQGAPAAAPAPRFHEAALARIHGLGRRGRSLIVLPVFVATVAFAVLTRAALGDFLATRAAGSTQDLWLSVVVAAALFALSELLAISVCIGLVSAVLRRVRRIQLRRRQENQLAAFLIDSARDAGARPVVVA